MQRTQTPLVSSLISLFFEKVGVFGAEVILKLIGLRQHYFTVPWNVFDLVVVVVRFVVSKQFVDHISEFENNKEKDGYWLTFIGLKR